MPEGHTVHRIALQLAADVVGHLVTVSSPQGRFAAGAALLDGSRAVAVQAVGKHLFLGFGVGPGPEAEERLGRAAFAAQAARWLRVHLGLYGAWDFHGVVSPVVPGQGAVGSMGAPRLRRAVRIGEAEAALPPRGAEPEPDFPPEPVGQVRVRLLTEHTVADLRGPAACEVLTPQEVAAVVAKAGPDPLVSAGVEAEEAVVENLRRRRTAVGQLLMDQSVVSGIGNIYRAEMLFRAGLDPHTPGRDVPDEVARGLWQDWVGLLGEGVRTGVMVTRADLDDEQRELAITEPALRHAVYGRAGEPCLACRQPVVLEEMAGRKLYWCSTCQV